MASKDKGKSRRESAYTDPPKREKDKPKRDTLKRAIRSREKMIRDI